ncbi:MAG: sulfotransferase [Rhodospirillaceae bacterium]|nr:sulfotransferase [Rhodospirillaceae bacterium]
MSPPCVIILGMHRSGTSLVAGSLQAAGLRLGTVNDQAPFNSKGNKENVRIRELNDAMLDRIGASWKRPPARQITWLRSDSRRAESLLRPYLSADRAWGFKDPRTIWTVEGWLQLLPDAQLVGVFRHPALVAQSLVARTGALSIDPGEAFELWSAYNAELLRLERKYRFPLVHFGIPNKLREEFFAPLTRLARSLGLSHPVDAFFDDGLIHQRAEHLKADTRAIKLHNELLASSEQQGNEPADFRCITGLRQRGA